MEGQVTQGSPGRQKRDLKNVLTVGIMGAIFLAAAYLRLWGLQYSFTGGDQAMLLNIALRWVTQGIFPLAAHKSSAGLMNPPLPVYLLAISLFLRRDLVWVAQFLALLNVASVGFTYFVLRLAFSQRAALLATLLYAVSPWSVYYSRLIWNPTAIPLFSTLLLGGLLAAFTGRRKALHLTLIFLWVAAAVQLHTASLVLIPAVGLLFWIFRRRLTIRPLLIGALLFMLSFVPFMVYELETRFMDLADFRQATEGSAETNLASVAIGLALSGEEGIWQTMGQAWWQWREAVPWGESLKALPPWLLLAGLMVAGWQLLCRRDEFQTRRFAPGTVGLIVVVVLFAVPLLSFVRHTVYLQNYYLLYLYPMPFAVMALPADAALVWADKLPTARRRVLLPLAWLPAIFIVLLAGRQFYLNHVGLRMLSQGTLGERQIWHVQRVIDTFAEWSNRHPDCDLIIASDGYEATDSILGQVGEFLAPRPVRFVRLGSGVIVPRTCAIYAVASDDPAHRAWYEAHATLIPDLSIPLSHDAWHFYELSPPARDALVKGLTASPPLGQWDNGVQLRGYEATVSHQPGGLLGLTLTWEVYNTPPKQRYHFFNHLLDENGTLVTQADGPGVFSRYWQAGEFFVTWFDIAVPADISPGLYRLIVGLYDWPSLDRPRLSDGRDSLPLMSVEIPFGEAREPGEQGQ